MTIHSSGISVGSESDCLVGSRQVLCRARIACSHELNWIKAIRGEAKASSPLEYAAQLTETMLLGLVALRAGQGRKILYDGERGQITNIADANQYLSREYRAGWAI